MIIELVVNVVSVEELFAIYITWHFHYRVLKKVTDSEIWIVCPVERERPIG